VIEVSRTEPSATTPSWLLANAVGAAICRTLALALAALAVAVSEKPAGRFMIRSRTRVVKRYPEGDWKNRTSQEI
jgi:hypothetical protein